MARLFVGLSAIGLTVGAAADSKTSSAQTNDVAVFHDGNRLVLQSPYLHLEFELRRPSLEVVRVAPSGDWQHGSSLGSLVEEATAGQRRWRSTVDDVDGARASWETTPTDVRVRIEGLDAGNVASATWLVTVPHASPDFRLDRVTTLRGQVDALGLAITTPAVPDGTDPASLARIVSDGKYRPEIGPAQLERPGGTLGLLAVDNPELSFSARVESPDRVIARQEGSFISLTFSRHFAQSRSSGQIQDGYVFRFGLNNDFLVPRSDAGPDVERRLLAAGYYGNAVISPTFGPVLSASMRDYRGSVWSRDFDYAIQGYSYVLDDMSVFRNNLQKFLERVDRNGVAPEYLLLDGQHGNRETWDSMANVIQATHTFVSKTGDLDFYRQNEANVKRALGWIRALDTDGDGLPDRDIFPYGYTDTVENGPMHTYAIAKHYAAYLAVADLDEAIGEDARAHRAYARTMQASFRRPLAQGGYWNPETGYPIAWKRDSGLVVTTFETFGVFEAIRVGLLTDPDQLQSIATWMDANREAFLNGNPYPERLMIGGYDLRTKKAEVPQDKLWIMDCNAPWITGISVPARVTLGRLADARAMLDVYASSSYRSTPHAEFGAGPQGVFGPGETADGGRLWDNWSWFNAVYGTHFGLKMMPQWLEVAPAPLDPNVGHRLYGVTYQGSRIDMELIDGGYRIALDHAERLILKPPYGYSAVDVNGDGNFRPSRTLTAEPGVTYVVRGTPTAVSAE